MLHHLRRFLALDRRDRLTLIGAYLSLGAISLLLRVRRFPALVARERYARAWAKDDVASADYLRARRYAYWIDVASRHHVARARCLQRSLVLQHWLRREGLPGELRIGVRKEAGELKAHAWVELAGQVVNDEPAALTGFKPLAGGASPSQGTDLPMKTGARIWR